jgi:hypothetical protein
VKIAVDQYGADASDSLLVFVRDIAIWFPSMHAASSWAAACGISGQVRLLTQHSQPGPRVGYMAEPVTVVYEF